MSCTSIVPFRLCFHMHIVISPNGLHIGKREIKLQFEYYKRRSCTSERREREIERERGRPLQLKAQMLSTVVPSFYSVFPALLVDAGIWKDEPGG